MPEERTNTRENDSIDSEETLERDETSREVETRAQDDRPSDNWVPASNLPDPKPLDGYKYRWIRVSTLGESDGRNVGKKFREGWQPVPLDEQPDMKAMRDFETRWPDNIEIGGLLLCKQPLENVERRNRYYREKTQRQMGAISEEYLKDSDRRVPRFDETGKTRVSFGKA